jgi:hypothetical protein
MSYAQKFYNIAIREGDVPADGAWGAEGEAFVACAGGIDQLNVTGDRDGFIKQGFEFLDGFKESAERSIVCEQQQEEPREDLIRAIRDLVKESKQVELGEFFVLLAEDWDERYAEE